MDVVVVGAGQAGLSAAYFLKRANLDHVVLDADGGPGGAWRHRWPTLRMATVHGIHDLPGMPFAEPDPTAPANEVLPAYFADFERRNGLDVRRPVRVHAVRDHGGLLRVETDHGAWETRALVNATGTWTRPFWPRYPGQELFRGRQLHSSQYRGPEEFTGQHVVVVGGGTSAVQQLLEIDRYAARTTWATRREPEFFDEPFTPELGRAVVAKVDERVRQGLPPRSVVSVTGLNLTPAVRDALRTGVLDRRPVFERITEDGVVWPDGTHEHVDAILWATGFRAALDHLAPLRLRGPGGGIGLDGTRVVADPRVHLVGYGPSASTVGATRAGRAAAREIKASLSRREAA
ncbi:cation diffusion facilitator CzcD-associated flavoprotein CzcO [Saccharothrix saharensis]|uniref:Cation diffusion facilitator CzcD-associated flavoprotein CzcO n=1 Tax=Saccharothrix saharensis TaxID=571190 RepID=A0A543JD76_9PSEU|nr:FAD-dependent oxidoreductase [Saccharothrix saharensis]TQM80760.1 cation diffusion facilitator CzcD-associated flavoprotein CzcO [Saccharothrix saharensis]